MRCGLGQPPAFPRKSSRSPSKVLAPRGHSLLVRGFACPSRRRLLSVFRPHHSCLLPTNPHPSFPLPASVPHTWLLFGAEPYEASLSLFDPEHSETCNSHLPSAGYLSFLSLSSEVTLYFWQSLTLVRPVPRLSASRQVFFCACIQHRSSALVVSELQICLTRMNLIHSSWLEYLLSYPKSS